MKNHWVFLNKGRQKKNLFLGGGGGTWLGGLVDDRHDSWRISTFNLKILKSNWIISPKDWLFDVFSISSSMQSTCKICKITTFSKDRDIHFSQKTNDLHQHHALFPNIRSHQNTLGSPDTLAVSDHVGSIHNV